MGNNGSIWNRYLEWRRERAHKARQSGHWPFLSGGAEKIIELSLLIPVLIGIAVLLVVGISRLL